MGTPAQERKAPHSSRSPRWGRAWAGGEPVELSTTGDDHEGEGRRAKHTGRHCTPHTPKLTSGGTCPSHHWPLSGHRDSSRQRIPKREGDSGAVSRVGVGDRLQSLLSPEGWPHLVRVARQVRGQLLGLHVPHFERAVAAAADQEPAVGRPRDLVHGSHMAAQGGQVPGPGGRAMRMDVRSWDTSEGCSRPPAVVLNCGCVSGLPGNPYKISLPGPHPGPI